MFKLEHLNDSGARAGEFKTGHCSAKTPFLMPAATKAGLKHVTSDNLKNIGINALICNGFLLSLQPGLDVIHDHGGIHKFLNFDKIIFTDSGGFQMIDPHFLIKLSDNGVLFKNPFDLSKVKLTPEDVMGFQTRLGSDVAMPLDDHRPYGSSKQEIAEAVKRTTYWAKRSKKAHGDLEEKQQLFGICQGGVFSDLRSESVKQIVELDFDGYAFGGLCIGEQPEEMYNAISSQAPLIPENKPRYVMGVGSPLHILNCVEKGVDIFDSCYATRNARHNSILTWQGEVNLKFADSKSKEPLDKECGCFVCKNYSRAFIYFHSKQNQHLAHILRSHHNLYFMQRFMERIRAFIVKDEFLEFKKEIETKYSGL